MSYLIIPENYKPLMSMQQTEQGIKLIKEFFQQNRIWVMPRPRLSIHLPSGNVLLLPSTTSVPDTASIPI